MLIVIRLTFDLVYNLHKLDAHFVTNEILSLDDKHLFIFYLYFELEKYQ